MSHLRSCGCGGAFYSGTYIVKWQRKVSLLFCDNFQLIRNFKTHLSWNSIGTSHNAKLNIFVQFIPNEAPRHTWPQYRSKYNTESTRNSVWISFRVKIVNENLDLWIWKHSANDFRRFDVIIMLLATRIRAKQTFNFQVITEKPAAPIFQHGNLHNKQPNYNRKYSHKGST